MSTQTQYEKFVLPNYGPPQMAISRGKGSWVWDEKDKPYLDLTSGIAVTGLGHCHPAWVKRLRNQAEILVHVSNLYANRNQSDLAEKICLQAGKGKVFFSNSGAETNEALIKLARLFGREKAGDREGKVFKVICAENAFHGRTMGGLSATPQAKVQKGFAPLLPGFAFARLNDLESFSKAIDDQTAAVMVETIQGEGGIHPASAEFLQGLRKLCTERNILLLIDEVQCGIGRTGSFFAFQQAGIQPDVIGMAKGLGSGFPIGAVWVAEPYTSLLAPGTHGSTFGGNPLACAAGLATLEIMEDQKIVEKVAKRSIRIHRKLNQLRETFPRHILEVRGRGYMIGLPLAVPVAPIIEACRKRGLLVLRAGEEVLRLLPPLTLKPSEFDQALDILESVFQNTAPPEESS